MADLRLGNGGDLGPGGGVAGARPHDEGRGHHGECDGQVDDQPGCTGDEGGVRGGG